MLIHEIQCFGADRRAGNRALVVEDCGFSADDRLLFAALARRPACVFISQDRVVDYIYPHGRSPLCLHATLAAARVLFLRHTQEDSITVHTAVHGQALILTQDQARYFVELSAQDAPMMLVDPGAVATLLRCSEEWLAGPAHVRSVGSAKLLVPMRDTQALRALEPDLAALVAWSKDQGINGIYAYVDTAVGHFEGRNFNHLDPALEDNATGVAAGALAVLFGQDLVLHQGERSGNPCLLHARIEGKKVQVGGLAVPSDTGAILHDLDGLEPHVREQAIADALHLDAILAIPALLRRLDDEDAHVRNVARMMFQRLQTPDNADAFEFYLPEIHALRRNGREDHSAAVDVTLSYLQRAARRAGNIIRRTV
jgi:PhzF family phenazine biosynthesis protein